MLTPGGKAILGMFPFCHKLEYIKDEADAGTLNALPPTLVGSGESASEEAPQSSLSLLARNIAGS